MEAKQAVSGDGLEFDLVSAKQLILVLCLGAIPALLAWILDGKALQSWDLPLSAAVLAFGLVLVFRAHPKALSSFPWRFTFLIALVPPLVAMFALDGPVTNDERAFVFEAELLADGHLSEPLVAPVAPTSKNPDLLRDVFVRRQLYEDVTNARRFSKYAPGTSLSLVPGTLLGAPLLSTLFVALLDLWLILLIARRLGLRNPGIAVLLLGTSPFFLLLHTSMQSEVFTTPAVLVAYWAMLRVRAGGHRWAMLVGAAAGWILLARPLTALLCALICGGVLLLQRQRLRSLPWAILGGLPFLAFALWWNQEFTGDFLTPVYSLYARDFGPWYIGTEKIAKDVYGNGDFLAGMLRQSGRWSVAFGGMLGAVGLAFWGAWRLRKRDGGVAILLSSLLPIVYALHWYAGHRAYLGPLYSAESLALLSLGLLLLLEQAPLQWRRGLVIAMVSSGGLLFAMRWSLIQEESFLRSAPQRVAAAEAPPDAGAIVFLPLKYQGMKEKAYKYWTPSLPSDLDSMHPVVLRSSKALKPRDIVAWLGLEGRPLYRYIPSEDAPLGGYLEPWQLNAKRPR